MDPKSLVLRPQLIYIVGTRGIMREYSKIVNMSKNKWKTKQPRKKVALKYNVPKCTLSEHKAI